MTEFWVKEHKLAQPHVSVLDEDGRDLRVHISDAWYGPFKAPMAAAEWLHGRAKRFHTYTIESFKVGSDDD